MIKKLLFVLLLTLTIGNKLQVQEKYIVFMDKNGERVADKMLASSYSFIQKLPGDSAWFVKEFDMRDTIISSGYYSDEKLTIPTGKFIYYEKKHTLVGFGGIRVDTINHIKVAGYFLNGKKNGIWREYEDGKLRYLKTYANDKLDGLYQDYTLLGNTIAFEGYFVNGHKEGDWCTFGNDGFVSRAEVYNKKGVIVKRYNYVGEVSKAAAAAFKIGEFYKPAVMPFDLYTYLKRRTIGFKTPDHVGTLVLKLAISREGVVTEAKVEQVANYEFDDLVVKAFMNSPKWKPAMFHGEKVDSSFTITLNIVDVVGAQSLIN